MSGGVAFGFKWDEVECVLVRWHGLEINPQLFAQLSICESEMLKIDLEEQRRKASARKSQAGR